MKITKQDIASAARQGAAVTMACFLCITVFVLAFEDKLHLKAVLTTSIIVFILAFLYRLIEIDYKETKRKGKGQK